MTLMLRTVFAMFSIIALSAGQTTGSSVQVSNADSSTSVTNRAPATSRGTETPAEKNDSAGVALKPGQSAAAETPASPARGKGDSKGASKGKNTQTAPVADDEDDSKKPYVIGPLDVLQITVWNDVKLSGVYSVGPDGFISMQLIGQFKADGLTADELKATIGKKLQASVMNEPEVNIQVLKINSKKYYIYGGCTRNGEFPLIGSMTFMDAFANCGGFREFTNTKKIYILRGDQKIPFNYVDVSKGKHMDQNRHLRNGDRIFVPEQ